MSKALFSSIRLYNSCTRNYVALQPLILQKLGNISSSANFSTSNLLKKNLAGICALNPIVDRACVKYTGNLDTRNIINKQWRGYSNQKSNKKGDDKTKFVISPITKSLTYISTDPTKLEVDEKTLTIKTPINRPLCIIFGYLMAKKKHLLKYSKIYTDLGFDVLLIELTAWQLLWPTKGAQLVAADTLNFLNNNQDKFPQMAVHGFSVGGYQWGEIMVLMSRDLPKYQPLLERIRAQIWDSSTDISEIPVGMPKAIFPKNKVLQAALRNYAIYHLKAFYQVATVHYARSSNIFHFPILKCPSLFLVSEIDPIGLKKANWTVKENMESLGIKTAWKCWPDSLHVMHKLKYPEEYHDAIISHLQESNMLEDVKEKRGALKV